MGITGAAQRPEAPRNFSSVVDERPAVQYSAPERVENLRLLVSPSPSPQRNMLPDPVGSAGLVLVAAFLPAALRAGGVERPSSVITTIMMESRRCSNLPRSRNFSRSPRVSSDV